VFVYFFFDFTATFFVFGFAAAFFVLGFAAIALPLAATFKAAPAENLGTFFAAILISWPVWWFPIHEVFHKLHAAPRAYLFIAVL
jgi:hypothetical protein